VQLKNFLSSLTGVRLLEALAFFAPELGDGSHGNKTLVASGRVEGYQAVIGTIVRLTREDPNAKPPADASPNYASLDDDAAWKEIDKENGVDKTDEPTTS